MQKSYINQEITRVSITITFFVKYFFENFRKCEWVQEWPNPDSRVPMPEERSNPSAHNPYVRGKNGEYMFVSRGHLKEGSLLLQSSIRIFSELETIHGHGRTPRVGGGRSGADPAKKLNVLRTAPPDPWLKSIQVYWTPVKIKENRGFFRNNQRCKVLEIPMLEIDF